MELISLLSLLQVKRWTTIRNAKLSRQNARAIVSAVRHRKKTNAELLYGRKGGMFMDRNGNAGLDIPRRGIDRIVHEAVEGKNVSVTTSINEKSLQFLQRCITVFSKTQGVYIE